MALSDFYNELQYTDLLEIKESSNNPLVEEYAHLKVDKIYFSGKYPAIFFKEVNRFDDESLKVIAEVQHLAWNYRKVMFLFAVSPSEIRVYNCCRKPFNYKKEEINFQQQTAGMEIISAAFNDRQALEILKELFSRMAVDSGVFWTSENSLRSKINVQERIDRYLVDSLLTASQKLASLGLSDNIIHSLMMRSIFIMYLEDKGAAKETALYSTINKNAQSYIDILQDKSDTYSLFKEVELHFNGNVFPVLRGEEKQVKNEHLEIIRKCLTDGNLSDDPVLFKWRLFKFDVIQIELLSEIYENFLEEFKILSKQEAGQYYTPPSLVELILNEKLKTADETNWNIKILDPASGSGIFLVESFKRLVKRWKNANPDKQIKFDDLREILKKNIYGIELDKLAIRVAAFSLYLAMVEQLNPKTLWSDKRYKFPYLINDPNDTSLEKQGGNLFRADTIGEINPSDFPKFDLVVGNPPFGSKIKLRSVKKFIRDNGFGSDLVIPFLHKAIDFTDDGSVALIFNTKILTNTEKPFQKFRDWLLNKTYVEKIFNLSIFRKAHRSFGGQLFTSAVGPVSIIFYQKKFPQSIPSTIEYWAPKTYVKNNLVEGVIIDATDIKYLPRTECQQPNTKIWKIAMWGTLEDFILIEKLKNKFTSLKKYLAEHDIKSGVGFQLLTDEKDEPVPDDDIASMKFLDADFVEPYYTPIDNLKKINSSIKTKKAVNFYLKYFNKRSVNELPTINVFRRLGDKNAYVAPHFVIKKGLKDGLTCASYLDYKCSFRDGVYGFYGSSDSEEKLKIIATFLNSSISNYFLFLSISSYGIERDQIMKHEYLEMPFPPLSKKDQNHLLNSIDELIQLKKKDELFNPITLSKEIDNIFLNSFNLSDYEKYLIEDTMQISIDLFHNGINSRALKPVEISETESYAVILSESLNSFLASELKVSAKIFNVNKKDALNLIILKFVNQSSEIERGDENEIRSQLNYIDKVNLSRMSESIYIKRQIKFFDENIIYLIKPNQKRFWSRSMAINDSRELISEILKMEYSE